MELTKIDANTLRIKMTEEKFVKKEILLQRKQSIQEQLNEVNSMLAVLNQNEPAEV